MVDPSVSILAEPPVTWVDKVVNKRGTEAVAKAYLEYLVFARRAGDRREEFLSARGSKRSRRSTRTCFRR